MAAELRDFAPGIELTGELRATQRAVLAAEVSGKVITIEKRVGEKCSKGKTLLKIDPASYEVAVQGARATLEQERQKLDEMRAGPLNTELAAQQALVDSAQARFDDAAASLERYEELHEKGYVTDEELSKARAAADGAKAALERELQNLRRMQEGTRTESLAAQEARVAQAEAGLKAAELALSRTAISPAFDGEVNMLMCELGQYVGPGTPLLEVVSTEPPEAWFNSGEDSAGLVTVGGLVELSCSAFPELRFAGKVISIAPQADATTRQFPVRVSLDAKELRAGMAVTGRFLSGDPQPTLMISADATLQTELGTVVWRLVSAPPEAAGEEGKQTRRGEDAKALDEGNMPPLPGVESVPVEVGMQVDGWYKLISGAIKAGDVLVTRGKENLYPGAKVMPSQPPQAAAGANTNTQREGLAQAPNPNAAEES